MAGHSPTNAESGRPSAGTKQACLRPRQWLGPARAPLLPAPGPRRVNPPRAPNHEVQSRRRRVRHHPLYLAGLHPTHPKCRGLRTQLLIPTSTQRVQQRREWCVSGRNPARSQSTPPGWSIGGPAQADLIPVFSIWLCLVPVVWQMQAPPSPNHFSSGRLVLPHALQMGVPHMRMQWGCTPNRDGGTREKGGWFLLPTPLPWPHCSALCSPPLQPDAGRQPAGILRHQAHRGQAQRDGVPEQHAQG